jgi:phage terminase large subunit GpA-like protein
MSPIGPKPISLRLDPASYENLRQQVLLRDGWRCQSCGTMANLEVHHKRFRSHCGDDSEQNLITLCSACHASVHKGKTNGLVRYISETNSARDSASRKYKAVASLRKETRAWNLRINRDRVPNRWGLSSYKKARHTFGYAIT